MNWNQTNKTFLEESRDLLWDMEDALLRIENGGGEEEVNTIFQAVHTLSESAEFFGCTHVVPFAHSVESLVRKIRAYEIKPEGKLITSLFLCCDLLRGLVNHMAPSNAGNPDASICDLVEYFTSADETAMLRSVAGGEATAWLRRAV
jgi:two-component system chemotaxis sensor kinase CheA